MDLKEQATHARKELKKTWSRRANISFVVIVVIGLVVWYIVY